MRIGGYLGVSHANEPFHISNRSTCWVWKRGDVWQIWGSGDFLARWTCWLNCYLDHSGHWPAWCYVRPKPEALTGLGCSTAMGTAKFAGFVLFSVGLTVSTFDLDRFTFTIFTCDFTLNVDYSCLLDTVIIEPPSGLFWSRGDCKSQLVVFVPTKWMICLHEQSLTANMFSFDQGGRWRRVA